MHFKFNGEPWPRCARQRNFRNKSLMKKNHYHSCALSSMYIISQWMNHIFADFAWQANLRIFSPTFWLVFCLYKPIPFYIGWLPTFKNTQFASRLGGGGRRDCFSASQWKRSQEDKYWKQSLYLRWNTEAKAFSFTEIPKTKPTFRLKYRKQSLLLRWNSIKKNTYFYTKIPKTKLTFRLKYRKQSLLLHYIEFTSCINEYQVSIA